MQPISYYGLHYGTILKNEMKQPLTEHHTNDEHATILEKYRKTIEKIRVFGILILTLCVISLIIYIIVIYS
jgi:t-SNARE complex subunit (syntaxin)